MSAVEVVLSMVAFVVLGCLLASVLWMASWAMEEDEDER